MAGKRIHRRRDADPKEGLTKYGKTLFGDPVNKKYPIDTPGRIKAAWAYIHQPRNAGKYSAGERKIILTRIRKAAKDRRVSPPGPRGPGSTMARSSRPRALRVLAKSRGPAPSHVA